MGFEIYEGDEIDKSVKESKDPWERDYRTRMDAERTAAWRLAKDPSPEAGLEAGTESDHGRNDTPKNVPARYSSFQEAAEARRGEAKTQEKKNLEESQRLAFTNKLREDLGLPKATSLKEAGDIKDLWEKLYKQKRAEQAAVEEARANDIRRDLGLPEQTTKSEIRDANQPEISLDQEKDAHAIQEESPVSSNVPIIPNAKNYLEDLTARGDASKIANLDRSQIFRHSEDFGVFEEEIKRILAQNPEKPIKFLDIGIGNLEEPLSFLSVMNNKSKEVSRSLEESFDLRMVDIRNKEGINIKKGLGKTYSVGGVKIGGAFLTEGQKTSMQEIPIEPSADRKHLFALSPESGEYEFLPEVVEYAEKTLDDPAKASLSMPVENYLANLPETEDFDFIALNNVAQHLGGNEYANPFQKKGLNREAYDKFYQVVESLLQRVRKDGIIFLHTPSGLGDIKSRGGTESIFSGSSFFRDNFEEVRPGIYRRK